MKIKEELNNLVSKLGFKVEKIEEKPDETVETTDTVEKPDETIETTDTVDVNKDEIVDKAHEKAEKELDEINQLNETIKNIKTLLEEQKKENEKIKKDFEELKNTPPVESINNTIITTEEKPLTKTEIRKQFLNNLKK